MEENNFETKLVVSEAAQKIFAAMLAGPNGNWAESNIDAAMDRAIDRAMKLQSKVDARFDVKQEEETSED